MSEIVAQPEHTLVTIGEIVFSRSWVVTPIGHTRLVGTQIVATDASRTYTKTPTWAVVLAILGALFFLIGLLFLLAKETVTQGFVQVTVHNGPYVYTANIPVSHPAQVQDIYARVNHARAVIAAAV